jgi:hypothetical protein
MIFLLGAEFAQVGNDAKATRFLEELDNHPQIGGLIDATSPFEVEQAEMARKSVGIPSFYIRSSLSVPARPLSLSAKLLPPFSPFLL